MEYAIFPMQNVGVSQRHNTTKKYSHYQMKAIDIIGKDSGIEQGYAPFTGKVLAITTSANTIFFGSCDENGNKAQVMCEDGVARVITVALTHDNNINDVAIGRVFKSGEKFYDEGTKGGATGNHIHIEVALGWVSKKTAYTANGYLKFADDVSLYPHQIFFALKGWNKIIKANGYTWLEVDRREMKETQPVEPLPVVEGTRVVVCTKGTLNSGKEYPTRASKTASYDTKKNIKVGDILKFDDGYSANNANKDCLLRICGGSRTDLIGRWFAYDKNYFD
jgi:hypothetical protein